MRLRSQRSKKAVLGIIVITVSGIALAHENNNGNGVCSFEHNDIISDACASYSTIEKINYNLRPIIRSITQTFDYFGYYRLNLFGKQCPFWSDDSGMCGNIACAVHTIDDEKDIPPIWRAASLSKLEGKKAHHPAKRVKAEPSPLSGQLGEGKDESCIVEDDECDERDYCVPEDEAQADGDYVSLLDNPERFTGYSGEGAAAVWSAIYRENCFSRTPVVENTKTQNYPFGVVQPDSGAVNQLKQAVLDRPRLELVPGKDGKPALLNLDVDDQCLEKRVFYRVISGMHASISMHLCFDYLNQSTGQWGPNLDCYIQRFQGHPERIQNIYFNYALVLRAVAKLRNYLNEYTFCSADPGQDRTTKAKVLELAEGAASGPEIFDESIMFRDSNALELKEDFKNRFRNVSRLMDCVGCDKCRLWGKVQTQGYGTALKVLFEFDENKGVEENPPLRRTELVALINTLDKLSTALEAVGKFQRLWDIRNAEEQKAKLINESNDDGRIEYIADDEFDDEKPTETKDQQNKQRPNQEESNKKKKPNVNNEETILETVVEEIGLVLEAMRFVVTSWIKLPVHLWEIARMEVEHLWNVYYLRHPAPVRKLDWWSRKAVDLKAIQERRRENRRRIRDEL
ncbi:endoplasmic reticulum Oxidoreductin 1-domain-containing protein [Peziza echinospora]|nr:endoplasmic reticulum Oxidoreductin 1-domain-containing protein [Peziza echinospora]